MKWITYDVPPQPGGSVPLNPNFDTQLIANMTGASTFFRGRQAPTGTRPQQKLLAESS